jgi:hypothetical protein
VPFLSEDWTQLAALREVGTLGAALDPAREPLRPFQHAFFWLLAHCGLDPAGSLLPALARSAAFALQALSCAAVVGLARAAGLSTARSALALVLFALFPAVKALAWPAAIGSPGRVALELVALLLFVRRLQGARAATGALGLLAFVLALGFHESAFLLPAAVVLWAGCVGGATLRAGIERARAALRDPFVRAACLLAVLHVVHLAFLRPQRHHGAKSLASLPANGVKAALSLAPEWLREIGVEGLRGHRGTAGWIAACAALLVVLLAFALALRRGGLLRFAALSTALDLALPVVGAGFVQRYACLAAAFAALGLAAACATRRAALPVLALALCWAADSATDALEIRRAGAVSLQVAADARAARARVGPGTAIAVVDLPDMAGAEEDVPWFNWGAALFLEAHGAAGPWVPWRTRAFRTTSDVELVDPARPARAGAAGTPVLRFDGRGLVPCPP